ncbi:MAG: PEP-CTERM sorting domain-containing protein [Pirellulales bacterium]
MTAFLDKLRCSPRIRAVVAAGLLSLIGSSLNAASPIPGLFNTGVDGAGVNLPGGADDPHYAIIIDPSGLGDMVVPSDGFPIGPWIANGPNSQWIGPSDGNDAEGPGGDYFYETTFDTTGFHPTNWFVSGNWATDDSGLAILINGNGTANPVAGGFGALTPFVVSGAMGGVPGVNSLVFQVGNGGGPTGLRVEVDYSRAAPAGSVPIPGLHNTGVDAADQPLLRFVDDPHYDLVAGPLGGFPAGPVAVDDTAVENGEFPIPPWIPNSATSRWISPKLDGAGNAEEGFFYFQTTFDLTGLDPSTAVITGLWSTDNTGHEILLNGVATGNPQVGSFPVLSPFEISNALGDTFLPGINTLTFVVENAPASFNPAGLRVEGMVAHANPVPEPSTFVLAAMGFGMTVWSIRRRRHGR